ncbi:MULTISPECIES: Nif3-like dinuclear metal center hexameric protein [Fusobacterium]|uniref:Nif3-like dinuclear metal center hexameric protein n=1 Tax=Fusobacterium TaxID=848 RepID=UPI001476DE89|nr:MULTISPECIES: Nif3-like dinuclear metal center hexameric protein [Fusobacterium]NME35666.1 Nif3-like dinuclear metal center hexameric protein [Fusobacterium sp. FSA-380-WT-3A]
MILNEIIKILEKKFPVTNSEEWDNVGLLIGKRNKEIKNIQISLDITDMVLENAIKNNIDLIISHHPMIFSGIKRINSDTVLGNKIIKSIENNISIYTLHTNLDSTIGGLNDFVGERLGLINGKIIDEIKENECGIGRVYSLKEKEDFNDFLQKIKETFLEENIRVVGRDLASKEIKKIAIVNGAGSSYWRKAKKIGADLLITGDVKYHEALDALEENFILIDIGHYETEHFFGKIILKELEEIKDVNIIEFNDLPVFTKI